MVRFSYLPPQAFESKPPRAHNAYHEMYPEGLAFDEDDLLEDSPPAIVFPDDRTRQSYEIAARVDQIARTIPVGNPIVNLQIQAITFDPADRPFGERVLFWANDFLDTSEDEQIFWVRPGTLLILDAMRVRYRLAEPVAVRERVRDGGEASFTRRLN